MGHQHGERVRHRCILVIVATIALVAASCAADSPPESRVLRVLMTDDWASSQAFLDLVRDFEREHPGVRIALDKTAIRDIADTVRSEINRGSPPDVVQSHAFAMGAEGLAEPVDDLWRSRGLDDGAFLDGAVEDVTWAGRRYGVPLDTNAMVLIYDPGAYARAGLPLPDGDMTIAEFERQAAALTAADGSRKAMALPTSNWVAYGWIRANGGEVVQTSPDGTPRLTLDAPQVAEALAFLARLVRQGHAFPPTGGDASADPLALFQSGVTALHASGSWSLVAARDQVPGREFRATPLPRGAADAGTAMGGSSLFVPRGSRQRELAFDFMLAMISDPNAIRFAKEEGRLPVRLAAFDDPFFATPEMQMFLQELKIAHPFKLEAFPAAKQAFAEAVSKVLQGPARGGTGETVASALEDATAALREAQRVATATGAGR